MKYFFNTIKKSRGFSLVELLVVVAIMGTLATIAIPAYNNYRQQAKKAAYRTDVSSLHKGWLAFGVEIDSFCERETIPVNASITNVGMGGLVTSKLYGNTNASATCTNPAGTCSGTCTAQTPSGTTCGVSPCVGGNPGEACGQGSYIPAGNGPGRANFIGFGDAHTDCSNISATVESEHILRDASATTDAQCNLEPSEYKIGSFGHISGSSWIGHQVTHTGIVSERNNLTASQFNDTCT